MELVIDLAHFENGSSPSCTIASNQVILFLSVQGFHSLLSFQLPGGEFEIFLPQLAIQRGNINDEFLCCFDLKS